jgi:hypothetical protein
VLFESFLHVKIINMLAMRNFESTSGKFQELEIYIGKNYGQKEDMKLYTYLRDLRFYGDET